MIGYGTSASIEGAMTRFLIIISVLIAFTVFFIIKNSKK